LAALSLALCAGAAASWIIGSIHPSTLRWRNGPEQTIFIRLERWNLAFAGQAMTRRIGPGTYAFDTSTLGSEIVENASPHFRGGVFHPLKLIGLRDQFGLAHYEMGPPTPRFTVREGKQIIFSASFRYETMEIGWWLLILVFALFPGFLFWKRRRNRRRIRDGFCGNCGYDLRATPDRCPECGNEPKIVI
jgi:hypothetical protein